MKEFVRTALVVIAVAFGYIVAMPSVTHAAFSGCSASISGNAAAVRCLTTTDPDDRYSARATCRTQRVSGVFVGFADGLWVTSPSTSTARCLPPNVATSVERREVDW